MEYSQTSELYQFLINRFKAKKIHDKYDPEHFGNYSIILSVDSFLINYVQDRSFLTIEIASKSDPSNWYPLSSIVQFMVAKQMTNKKLVLSNDDQRIQSLNEFLSQNFELVANLFADHNYRKTKGELNTFLKNRFFDR